MQWLYPGLNIKRWLFLGITGLLSFLLGAFSLLNLALEPRLTAISPFWSGILMLLGVILGLVAFRKSLEFIIGLSGASRDWPQQVIQDRQLEKGARIVAIGGGTGLSSILRGLKKYTSNLTAIVTVADDGGSSGILRQEMGILPPGDIRNCLVALADTEPLMEQLFQYRFDSGEGLKGHSFGNLFIATLTDLLGDFEEAILESSKVLAIRGRVLPSTLEDIKLKAFYTDGTEVEGESAIPRARKRIARVELLPGDNQLLPEAARALQEADMIIIGPGSLYTSIIPNLLVGGMSRAISSSDAMKVYICNIMTQAGETDGYTASQHVREIISHTGEDKLFDHIVVNTSKYGEELIKRYQEEESYPVEVDDNELLAMGLQVIQGNFTTDELFIRHNPDKLARILVDMLCYKSNDKDNTR
ncbi:MAG: gluconeogenesis factor YvcK family protein [Halanaerobium sp.]|nr:gluconeogenesis factor YvcK family protein [Halanaerobium sp.]